MTVKSITAKQPHLSIVDYETGEVHLVTLSAIRGIARGDRIDDELSCIIAKAFLQFWDEENG